MSDESDPRAGLPSASVMHRTAQCPGSVQFVNVLRASGKHIPIESPYAPGGRKIHFYLANEVEPQPGTLPLAELATELDFHETQVANQALRLRKKLITEWVPPGFDGNLFQIVEKRFWYRTGMTKRFSGQSDFIAFAYDGKKPRALIINYKTGRIEAEPAADNLQLRTEVVLTKHKWPELEEIDAAIVEPLVSWDNERVHYDQDSLPLAEQDILQIVAAAEWPGAPRVAGPWCVHCPARVNCPEAANYVAIPWCGLKPELFNNDGEPDSVFKPSRELIERAIVEVPRGERGVELWEKLKLAKKVIETLEETYTKVLEAEPGALPGYILPELGRARRQVVAPAKFKANLAEYLSGEELDGCATYHLAEIERVLSFKHKLKGKKLEAVLQNLLAVNLEAGAILLTNDAPFIRPLTKKEREELNANPQKSPRQLNDRSTSS